MNYLFDIIIYKCNVLIYFSYDYYINLVSYFVVLIYLWYLIN